MFPTFTQGSLIRLMQRARRSRVLFKVVSAAEREILKLVIVVVEEVRSPNLATLIARIVIKLLRALNADRVEALTKGYKKASTLVTLASRWGNPSAENWLNDKAYTTYLALGLGPF